jgi:CO dehydrogenase/acetyl-CoA synthase alpha subunit
MRAKELRHKLITDFSNFIQDDTKLEVLEGIFDAIKKEESNSVIPNSHYTVVAEERANYFSKKTKSSSWDEVVQRLNTKYGF